MKHRGLKFLSLLLTLVLLVGLLPGMSMTALAADGDSTYTITIPSTLNVSGSGWNATDGISATGTLASGKKLTVTASSANSWALKQQDGSETVGYTMKETADGAAKTAWEFTALPGSATLGIDVADYSSKPAGTYQDTVTFTASVEDARQLYSITITGPYSGNTLVMEFYEGDKWSDMVEKYSLITKPSPTVNWVGFSTDGFIYKGSNKVLTTDTVDPNATYTIE